MARVIFKFPNSDQIHSVAFPKDEVEDTWTAVWQGNMGDLTEIQKRHTPFRTHDVNIWLDGNVFKVTCYPLDKEEGGYLVANTSDESKFVRAEILSVEHSDIVFVDGQWIDTTLDEYGMPLELDTEEDVSNEAW